MITQEEAIARMYQAGLRLTKARECLLRLVLGSVAPFSVKMLYERAESEGMDIHLATVHRNLAEFTEMGIVDKLPGEDNCLFALHHEQQSSAHVFCLDCRHLVALDAMDFQHPEELEALSRALVQQGFDASTIRLMLSAHCQTQKNNMHLCPVSGADADPDSYCK